MGEKSLHIAMYPWFAMGHLTTFLQLANKYAARGHKISFLMPKLTIPKFESLNHHPNLITLIPITVPHVDGLPLGTETTADVPFHLVPLIMIAMDLTQPLIQAHLSNLKPDFVFFDFSYWLPSISTNLGIKSVNYCTVSPAAIAYIVLREPDKISLTEDDLMNPPVGFPPSSIKLHAHEARGLAALSKPNDSRGISVRERHMRAFSGCDAISFKTCRETEGPFCDYIEKQFSKPVILAGPVVPDQTPINSVLDEKIVKILDRFQSASVVYCAFGSECTLKKDQFEELVLGLELTGFPFLAALKPPRGAETVESALPEGFKERMEGKGYVTGNWVQQQLILKHPSVGCFLTHCGNGSLSEGLVNKCQLVLLPNRGDQIVNARLMGGDFKVGVEVEKSEEEGLFTRYSVCKAVKAVMDDSSEVGKEVRLNHTKWREFLLSPGLENSYIDDFIHRLNALRY